MRPVCINKKTNLDGRPTAFTLVEMLVAVALVMILMTMFAQIFGLASGILSQQRGLAANDQSERMIRTIIREDLEHRTFKDVKPFASADAAVDDDRKGYFHITEGVIADGSDDVLQFTILKENDDEPLYGKAKTISGSTLTGDPNQPEFDDELETANDTGASKYGEVAYFLRNGNLYRRVMLIREPKVSTSVDPTSGGGSSLIPGAYSGRFWEDMDYSAFFDVMNTRVNFIGTDSLENRHPDSLAPQYNSMPVRFGIPRFRWGFDPDSGQPRRIVTSAGQDFHIGRFTHQETSATQFRYPGEAPLTNWLDPSLSLNYDSRNGVLQDLSDGSRISEDILLKNVHAFDIQVWDPQADPGPDGSPGVAGFDDNSDGTVDNAPELGWPRSDDGAWQEIGHTNATGFYRATPSGGLDNFGRNNTTFGEYPVTATNGNCFDTWHPTTGAGVMPGGVAPYRPVLFHLGADNQPGAAGVNDNERGIDGQPGVAGVDDDGMNGVDDPGEIGWLGSDDDLAVDDLNERGWTATDDTILPEPLRLIRIHIRYVDQKSDQMRDVIIVYSLTE